MDTTGLELTVKRLIRFDGEGTLKAYCDLDIAGRFLVKGLRVVHGKNGPFVSMPRTQGKDHKWYDQVVTLTKDVREDVSRVVLEAYARQTESTTDR